MISDIRTPSDTADWSYAIEILKEQDGWVNFAFVTGKGRNRFGWNGQRLQRGSTAVAFLARRAPHELEALTEWLEAGRP